MPNTHNYMFGRQSLPFGGNRALGLMLSICNRKLAGLVVWIICCPIAAFLFRRFSGPNYGSPIRPFSFPLL